MTTTSTETALRQTVTPPVQVLLLVVVVIALHAPFVNQAFHIDDRIYLEMARHVRASPLFPQDYPGVFFGRPLPDFASHTHPPGLSYVLAAGMLVAGQREVVLHALFLIFPVLAALAAYSLAARYTRHRFASALLYSFLPGGFVMANTLMTDAAFAAVVLVGIAAFARYLDSDKPAWAAVCAGGLFVAAMLNYLAPFFSVLLFLYARWRGAPRSKAAVLLTPVATVGCWLALNYIHYGRLTLLHTAGYLRGEGGLASGLPEEKFLYLLLALGGVMIPAVALPAVGRPLQIRVMGLVLLGTWSALAWQGWGSQSGERPLFAVFLTGGVWVMWEMLRLANVGAQGSSAVRSADERLLVTWFFGFCLVALFIYSAGVVRYLLPLTFPVVMLFVRRSEEQIRSLEYRRLFLGAVTAVTLAMALLLASADYEFAGVYRRLAADLPALEGWPGWSKVWITGEWGFRHYLEESGARVLTRAGTEPEPGDWMIKPALPTPYVTVQDAEPHSRLLERMRYGARLPLRLLDSGSQAGFYSHGWGLLPFSFNRTGQPLEIINVYRIENPYKGQRPELEQPFFVR